jgi:hypothetical protein
MGLALPGPVIREEKEMTVEGKAQARKPRFVKWWQFFTLALA